MAVTIHATVTIRNETMRGGDADGVGVALPGRSVSM